MLDADRIRLRRLELRLSQQKLGELIGQDQSYISRLERGQITDITVRTLERLATALWTNVESLLRREENESERVAAAVVQCITLLPRRQTCSWAE